MDNLEELNRTLSELIDTFQKNKLRVQDILIVYGNLGYALGASIEGFKGEGPSFEDLQKKYYENPTIGTALMLQGITITSWYNDYIKTANQSNEKEGENNDA